VQRKSKATALWGGKGGKESKGGKRKNGEFGKKEERGFFSVQTERSGRSLDGGKLNLEKEVKTDVNRMEWKGTKASCKSAARGGKGRVKRGCLAAK